MKRFLSVFSALALSGCAGMTTIAQLDRGVFTRDQYALAVADAPARAIVRNNPFAGDADDAGLIAAFSGRVNPPLALTKSPPATRRFDHRVVIQFGEPAHVPEMPGGFVAPPRSSCRR